MGEKVGMKRENLENKRLQVAYTHANAYMWAPVPQENRTLVPRVFVPLDQWSGNSSSLRSKERRLEVRE